MVGWQSLALLQGVFQVNRNTANLRGGKISEHLEDFVCIFSGGCIVWIKDPFNSM